MSTKRKNSSAFLTETTFAPDALLTYFPSRPNISGLAMSDYVCGDSIRICGNCHVI